MIIYVACAIPGMYPRIVRRILMKKSLLIPVSRRTPNGGTRTARMRIKIPYAVITIAMVE